MLHTLYSHSQVKKTSVINLINNSGAADIKKVLGEVSANVSDDDLNRAIAALKGKNIQTLIADGLKKVGDAGPAPAAGGKT